MSKTQRAGLWFLGSLLVLLVLAASWRATLPKRDIVIGAGPQGGTFAKHAATYAEALERIGFKVRVEHLGDSLRIVDRVNGPCPCFDIGFTAQAVQASDVPEVLSAGAIEVQPLFLFVRAELGAVTQLRQLAGKRVVMPLEHSASSEAARNLLALHAVSTQAPRYLPIREAAQALQRGEADAGFFMLAPGSTLIAQLAADPGLRLFSFEENLGISRRIEHLQPVLLPQGSFDVAQDRPPQDVRLLAASVNVVVRKDLHPVVLYALLNAMQKAHRGQTLVSDYGDFPSMKRTALPVHEKAEAWSKSGTPWLYEKLPPWLASPLDEYWGMALFIVAVSSVFGTLGTVIAFFRSAGSTSLRVLRIGARWLQRRLLARPQLGATGRGLLALTRAVLPDQPVISNTSNSPNA